MYGINFLPGQYSIDLYRYHAHDIMRLHFLIYLKNLGILMVPTIKCT